MATECSSAIVSLYLVAFHLKMKTLRESRRLYKLYLDAIKKWNVAYKGQELGNCLPTIGRQ